MRGRATYLVGERKIELGAHAMLWLFPDQDHFLLETSADFVRWILVLKPDYMRCSAPHMARSILAQNQGCAYRVLDEVQARSLRELFGEIAAAHGEAERFNIGLIYLALSAWARYQRARIEPAAQGLHPAIATAVQRMQLGSEEQLAQLAKRVGFSASALSRLFKKQMGISFVEFRNRCRIERFLSLYESAQGYSMMQAALRAGFGSYAQFYRAFSRAMGEAPSRYRSRLKNGGH